MELFMYVVGVIIASQLGFFIPYSWGKKNRGDDGEVRDENGVANKISDDENGEFRPDITRDVDVVIVGTCVAGAALAYSLAKDEWQVHVIERDLTEQDRVVGELLQPGDYLKLVDLGLEDCVEEIDFQKVFGYALYMDQTVLPFGKVFFRCFRQRFSQWPFCSEIEKQSCISCLNLRKERSH